MMFKDKYIHKLYAFALAAVFALTLAGCGGGGGGAAAPEPEPTPMPTAYEQAVAAIAAAETEEAARAAVATAVAAGISGAQLQSLNMAVDERVMALAAMAAADARAALVSAAMCEAATAECVAHHNALIEALKADLAALEADDDATNAQEAAARMKIAEAEEARNELQMQVTEIDRSTATGNAVGMAVDAANGLADMRSAEDIEAAEGLLATAKGMLTEDDDYAAQIEMAEMAIARAKARNAVDVAVMAAQNASAMLTDDQSKATVEAARAAVIAAKQAVMDNADALTDADETGFNAQIALAEAPVGPLESKIAAEEEEAEEQRMAMEEEQQRKANEEMKATAANLFAAIMPESGAFDATTSVGAAERYAGWNAGGNIVVGDGSELTSGVVELFEDKTATVAPLHGWQGRRFAVAHDRSGNLSNSDYEAVVYSDVGEPKMGAKFNSGTTDGVGFDLNSDGALAIAAATNLEARIASPSFDHSVGYKAFKLPESNLGGAVSVTIPGSYYGVAGTYACTPAAAADGCRVNRSANGYVLVLSGTGGGTWTFTPGNPDARVTEMPDMAYASYGWWLRKHGEEEDNWTASAFARPRGTVPAATDVGALTGSATYVGGAAGKYALSAPTGGTNEAGHFTATATLTAKFAASTDSTGDFLTGTIDRFKVGNDGAERDWSVDLNVDPTAVFNNINGTGGSGGTATTANANYTSWTIGGVTEEGDTRTRDEGKWAAQMYETGDDGVPGIVTGIFHAEYGNSGKMVGGFGAKKQ